MKYDPQPIHGFAESMQWDDMALPAGFWAVMEQTPSGCWQDKRNDRTGNYRETVVTRVMHVLWQDVFACAPTCGNLRCCRPAHLCVVLRNALSERTAF